MARPWFKHFSTASQGASLRILWDSNDYAAYGFWWRLLEMMAKWENVDNPGHMTISWGILKRELGWNRQRSAKVLLKIVSTFQIEVRSISGETFEVFIPKWLELQTTWGGKREARFEQDAGRSKKLDVRSKKLDLEEQKSERDLRLFGDNSRTDPSRVREMVSGILKDIKNGETR
jgi:hypothetical protein